MLEPQTNNGSGIWADTLTAEEVNFSKEAGMALKADNLEWASNFLAESKISQALECKPDANRSHDVLSLIKSALFEVRFAYAIHVAGCTAAYEFKTNEGNSSIDFCIFGKENNRNWLVELTSLRDSKAIKENSRQADYFYGYTSISKPNKNSPEDRDLVKVQQAILHKVTNAQGNPIKFPAPNEKIYSIVVLDVRALSLGDADGWDIQNIVYGSESINHINHGVYSRRWYDQNENLHLFKGIFDTSHPDQKTRILQERVHAIGFVSEKEYVDGEINSKIKLFPNPHLIPIEKFKDFRQSFPLMLT